MKPTVRDVGKVKVIDLRGKLTLGGGDLDLRNAVQGCLEQDQNRIVLNMKDVDYVDSAGIGELVACKKRAVAKGGDIRLLMPSASVYKVISIVSLHLVFQIFDSEAKAAGSF